MTHPLDERKDRLVAAGLCVRCGKRHARAERLHCQPCSEHDNARSLARYYSRNPSARRRAMRCGLCKTAGHDRRRCDDRRVE